MRLRIGSGAWRGAAILVLRALVLELAVGCGGEADAGDGLGGASGSASAGRGGVGADRGDPGAGNGAAGDAGADGGAGPDSGIGGGGGTTAGEAGAAGDGGACVTNDFSVSLARQPVDVIVVVDNSGSMHEENEAVERSLNQSFAAVLEGFALDYRVILITRHRSGARTTGETSANTSLCIAEPLSGAPECPVPLPVFSQRFFHYSNKVESFDALNGILDWYATPPELAEEAELAPLGYSAWLRAEASKAFVLFSDDDEGSTEDPNPLTIPEFVTALSALSVEHFGTPEAPTFSFHSVVGLKAKANPAAPYLPTDPIETEVCSGGALTIPAPGVTYQRLSILTGGLRFPICQIADFDVAFESIAGEVTARTGIVCDFALPDGPGAEPLDPSRVSVSLASSGGSSEQLDQVSDATACAESAYYVKDDRVHLCPAACESRRADPSSTLEVSLPCE